MNTTAISSLSPWCQQSHMRHAVASPKEPELCRDSIDTRLLSGPWAKLTPKQRHHCWRIIAVAAGSAEATPRTGLRP
jgi:hypothetical protein